MNHKARPLVAYLVLLPSTIALGQSPGRCVIADILPSAGEATKNVKLYCGPHSAGAAGVMADATLGFVRTISDVQNHAPQRYTNLERVSKIEFVDMNEEEKKAVAKVEAADNEKNSNFFDLHWQKVNISFSAPSTPPLNGVFIHDGCSIEDADKQSSLHSRVEALHVKTIQIQSKIKCTL